MALSQKKPQHFVGTRENSSPTKPGKDEVCCLCVPPSRSNESPPMPQTRLCAIRLVRLGLWSSYIPWWKLRSLQFRCSQRSEEANRVGQCLHRNKLVPVPLFHHSLINSLLHVHPARFLLWFAREMLAFTRRPESCSVIVRPCLTWHLLLFSPQSNVVSLDSDDDDIEIVSTSAARPRTARNINPVRIEPLMQSTHGEFLGRGSLDVFVVVCCNHQNQANLHWSSSASDYSSTRRYARSPAAAFRAPKECRMPECVKNYAEATS